MFSKSKVSGGNGESFCLRGNLGIYTKEVFQAWAWGGAMFTKTESAPFPFQVSLALSIPSTVNYPLFAKTWFCH